MTYRRFVHFRLFLALIMISFVTYASCCSVSSYRAILNEQYEMGYLDGSIATETVYDDYLDDAFVDIETKTHVLNEMIECFYQSPISAQHYMLTAKRIEAIIKKSNSKVSDSDTNKYIKYVMKWSAEYALDPVFITSIISRESHFKRKTVSSVGCIGPMQISPFAHADKLLEFGLSKNDLFEINHNVHIGCIVIKDYLEMYDYDYFAALKKYLGAVTVDSTYYYNDIFDMVKYGYSVR